MDSTLSPIDLDALARHWAATPAQGLHPPPARYAEDFGERGFGEAVRISNDHLIPRPLSLYFAAPSAAQMASIPVDAYLCCLLAALRQLARLFDEDREVMQITLGEGLAAYLGEGALAQLLDAVPRRLRVAARPEVVVSLRPRDRADPRALVALGCNRARLLDEGEHPPERLWRQQEALAGAGFAAIVQLLAWTGAGPDPKRLAQALRWGPDRIQLAGGPAHPIDPALLAQATQALSRAGYRPAGTDLYARASDPLLRTGQAGPRYCDLNGVQQAERMDLLGIGPGAYSQIGEVLCQSAEAFAHWRAALERGRLGIARGLVLSGDECVRAEVAQALACEGRLDAAALERNHGLSFEAYFAPTLARLQPLLDDGLAGWQGRTLRLARTGRLLWRIFSGCFRHPATAS